MAEQRYEISLFVLKKFFVSPHGHIIVILYLFTMKVSYTQVFFYTRRPDRKYADF